MFLVFLYQIVLTFFSFPGESYKYKLNMKFSAEENNAGEVLLVEFTSTIASCFFSLILSYQMKALMSFLHGIVAALGSVRSIALELVQGVKRVSGYYFTV